MSQLRHDSGSPLLLVDGLVVNAEGWSPELEASGLHAMHVTAGDWLSPFAVVCGQIQTWVRRIDEDAGRLFAVLDSQDVARIGRDERVGVILGLQNAALVGDDLDRVDRLHELGIRVMQLTYNDANLIADGCLEPRDAKLTRFGRRVIERCNDRGVVIDLSHVGTRSALEAAEASRRPVAVTHANRLATAPSPRNQPDEVLRAVAAGGGVIGVSVHGVLLWDGETPPTTASFVRQVHEMLELVGDDAVAIGTDAPGSMAVDLDATLDRSVERYPEIFARYAETFGNTLAGRYVEGLAGVAAWQSLPGLLRGSGLDETVVRKVCGENWVRFFGEQLRGAAARDRGDAGAASLTAAWPTGSARA